MRRADTFRLVNIVAPHIEHSIQPRAVVFEGDLGAELEELLFGELFAQTCVEIVGDVCWCCDHRVGEFDHEEFVA